MHSSMWCSFEIEISCRVGFVSVITRGLSSTVVAIGQISILQYRDNIQVSVDSGKCRTEGKSKMYCSTLNIDEATSAFQPIEPHSDCASRWKKNRFNQISQILEYGKKLEWKREKEKINKNERGRYGLKKKKTTYALINIWQRNLIEITFK